MLRWNDLKEKYTVIKKQIPEIIVSVDTEFNGFSTLKHSMLELAAYVIDARNGAFIDKFSMPILPRPGTEVEVRCMNEFWDYHPKKLKHLLENGIDHNLVMDSFAAKRNYWNKISKRQIYVASPSSVDAGWVNNYTEYSQNNNQVFPYYWVCLRSYKTALSDMTGIDWKDINEVVQTDTRNYMTPHLALDDAKAQAIEYYNTVIVAKSYSPKALLQQHVLTIKRK